MADLKTCSKCARTFQVVEVGGGMTSPEPEAVKCPHCGHSMTFLASGRLVARPVDDPANPPEPKG